MVVNINAVALGQSFKAAIVEGYLDAHPTDMLLPSVEWQDSTDLIKPPLFGESFWIKITPLVAPQSEQSLPWILALGNQAAADWVQLSIIKNGTVESQSLWGDKLPLTERKFYYPRAAFRVPWEKGEDITMLLQVKSPFLGAFYVSFNTMAEYMELSEPAHVLSIGYIAVAALMFMYHLFIFKLTREKAYLYYSGLCLGFFLIINSMNGYGYHYIWQNGFWFQDRALSFGLALSGIFVMEFIRSFTDPRKERMLYWKRYFSYSRWAGIVTLVLTILLPPLYGMILAMAISSICLAFFAIYSLTNRHTSKAFTYINIGLGLSGLGALMSSAVLWGLLPKNFYTSQAFIFTNIMDLFLFSSALAHRINTIKIEKEAMMRSLSGVVSDNILSDIAKNADKIPKSTVSAHVTVMFVDIVGFSKLFKICEPYVIVESLKETLSLVAEVIHSYGGTVDRSLGDGILVFFGYDLIGNVKADHPQIALKAAQKIQRLNVQRITKGRNRPVLPLRIGLNTAECFLGNIGKEGRIDFTIIGDGVNLASRYEAACSPHKIIMSENTWSHLSREQKEADNFQPINIKIKHSVGVTKAYEYDPFIGRKEDLPMVENLYWQSRQITQGGPRYKIAQNYLILKAKEGIDFQVIDLSLGGFAVLADEYFSRGVQLMIALKSPYPEVEKALMDHNLDLATVEVCWSRKNEGVYKHGLKVIGFHSESLQRLFDTLKAVIPFVDSHQESA